MNYDEKQNISKLIKNISLEECKNDYLNLLDRYKKNNLTNGTIIGNKFINYFTFIERLNTIGKKGISFYDFINNNNNLNSKSRNYPPNLKLFEYKKKKSPKSNDIKLFYGVFQVYYGSISVFKPSISINIYERFKPNTILDFTMGWGGRLVGACIMNIPNYIGIDLNLNLKTPYLEMTNILKDLNSTTNINLIFQDALEVDYSLLEYDLVFTSPPYFNIEIYEGTQKKSKKDWIELFYKPIILKTFKYLKKNGFYILNIPIDVYENVVKLILGDANELIPFKLSKRNKTQKYTEFIYVWKK